MFPLFIEIIIKQCCKSDLLCVGKVWKIKTQFVKLLRNRQRYHSIDIIILYNLTDSFSFYFTANPSHLNRIADPIKMRRKTSSINLQKHINMNRIKSLMLHNEVHQLEIASIIRSRMFSHCISSNE